MCYTVWSRGRLIGETDLAFARIVERSRSGWFHPNAEGDRLMPIVASVLPAIRAYLRRDAVDAEGAAITEPARHRSTLFADLAEAFQHLGALDLELRRDDGAVIPTLDIDLHDTHQLLELANEVDDRVDDSSDECDASECDASEWEAHEWSPDELEEPPRPRYQIHLTLLDDEAIP